LEVGADLRLAGRAVRAFKPLWIALLFAPELLGQTSPLSSVQHPTNEEIRGLNQAMVSTANYCLNLADYSISHQPRLFANTGDSNETMAWYEFSSKAEWGRAGKPKPVAFAWYKDNKVIRAVFSFQSNTDGGGRYAEYCYRADGHLAELRSGVEASTVCDDNYFRCQLSLPREQFYLPNAKIINVIQDDQRLLKSEKTQVSLSPKPPEYLAIWNLPFASSLFVRTK
jgi:hypothetical protein